MLKATLRGVLSTLCLLCRAGHSLLSGCCFWHSERCLAVLCMHGPPLSFSCYCGILLQGFDSG